MIWSRLTLLSRILDRSRIVESRVLGDFHQYPAVTGPESALQGHYYIYIEASGQFRDSVARYVCYAMLLLLD